MPEIKWVDCIPEVSVGSRILQEHMPGAHQAVAPEHLIVVRQEEQIDAAEVDRGEHLQATLLVIDIVSRIDRLHHSSGHLDQFDEAFAIFRPLITGFAFGEFEDLIECSLAQVVVASVV